MKRSPLIAVAVVFALAGILKLARRQSAPPEVTAPEEAPRALHGPAAHPPDSAPNSRLALSPSPTAERFLVATADARTQGDSTYQTPQQDDAGMTPIERSCRVADGGDLCASSCRSDADCSPGTFCGSDLRSDTMNLRCRVSDCSVDADCAAGEECLPASSTATDSGLKRCAPLGPRKEGEACEYGRASERCAAGLACVGNSCLRTCEAGQGVCRVGEKCVSAPAKAVCVPSCASSADCAEGQTCIQHGAVGQCRKLLGKSCLESPCAPGHACTVQLGREEAVTTCRACCNPLEANPCGKDGVCGMGDGRGGCSSVCYHACTSQLDCTEGARCSTVDEELTLWGCKPEAR